MSVSDLKGKKIYRYIKDNNYYIEKNHYLKGRYLYNGDIIRIENVQYTQLVESAEMLSEILNYSDITIAIFSLTQNNIETINYEKLTKLYNIFN